MKAGVLVITVLLVFGFFALSTAFLWDRLVVSDETMFLVHQARTLSEPGAEASTAFLVYPFLPLLGALLFPDPILFTAWCGLISAVVIILVSRWTLLSPSSRVLLAAAVLFSPGFLVELSRQPANVGLVTLLLLSAWYLLRFRETHGVQNLFLAGLCLGASVLFRWETWWVVPLWLLALFLFFPWEGWGKTGSLVLVTLFPLAFFGAVLLFVNWMTTADSLFFLRNSPFSYHALRGTLLPLPRLEAFGPWLLASWPSLLPFLALFFHDRLRSFLALGFFLVGFWAAGGNPFPGSSAFLVLALPFLFPADAGNTRRTLFQLLLAVSLILGWWQAAGPGSLFEPVRRFDPGLPPAGSFFSQPDTTALVTNPDDHLPVEQDTPLRTVVPQDEP